jgi:hypothetical protein
MARRTGRPRWAPPNLEEVRKLAASGLTMDQIADALGTSRTTLFKKKREFADFADAIKKGAAEGIIVATSKLFQMVKGGNLGAVIFYLKSRAGWREHSDGANANIKLNISGRGERMEEEIEAERQEQMKNDPIADGRGAADLSRPDGAGRRAAEAGERASHRDSSRDCSRRCSRWQKWRWIGPKGGSHTDRLAFQMKGSHRADRRSR